MESPEMSNVKELLTKFIKDEFQSSATSRLPPSLIPQMEKLIDHIAVCNHTYEYSCHHIPKWYAWIKPEASDEEMHLSRILGWIFQFVTSCALSFDDVADKAELRFGRPTWYNLHKNTDYLLFDMQLIQSWPYLLLNKYFSNNPLYNQLVDFLSSTWYSAMKTCRTEIEFSWKKLKQESADGVNDELINFENYKLIAREKIAAVHMFLALSWTYTLAGYDKNEYPEIYENAREISHLMGILMATMDDYFDCFTDMECCDDVDLDIKNGQLTWLLVKAKELCSAEQWKELLNNYGSEEPVCINIVRKIYKDIGIPEEFEKSKRDQYAKLHERINQLFKPEHELLKKAVVSYVEFVYEIFTG